MTGAGIGIAFSVLLLAAIIMALGIRYLLPLDVGPDDPADWSESDQALCFCSIANDVGEVLTSVHSCPAHGEATADGREPWPLPPSLAGKDVVSDCCGQSVRTEGRTSQYYVCTSCGEPCDAVPAGDETHDGGPGSSQERRIAAPNPVPAAIVSTQGMTAITPAPDPAAFGCDEDVSAFWGEPRAGDGPKNYGPRPTRRHRRPRHGLGQPPRVPDHRDNLIAVTDVTRPGGHPPSEALAQGPTGPGHFTGEQHLPQERFLPGQYLPVPVAVGRDPRWTQPHSPVAYRGLAELMARPVPVITPAPVLAVLPASDETLLDLPSRAEGELPGWVGLLVADVMSATVVNGKVFCVGQVAA